MTRAVLFAVLLVLAPLAGAAPSAAQNSGVILAQGQEGPGIFRFLFGDRRDRPIYRVLPGPPPPPPPAQQRATPRRTVTPKASTTEQRVAPAPQVVEVPKSENARRVLVLGDFFARSAAKGLAAAYAANPDITVIEATNGSSGLVRDDYYDWPGSIPALVEEHKPGAIIVMIGANDRQAIRTGAGSIAFGDEGWRAAYVERVAALADALGKTGVPVLWGGLIPAERSVLSRDYSTFNAIYREGMAGRPIRFVDLWDGFADAEGQFSAVGPDVQGQSVRLRDSDGLNFTRAGQAKLAFFFQRDLDALIGGTLPVAAAPGAIAAAGGPAAPAIGPMVPIAALTIAIDDTLSSPGAEPGEDVAEAVANRLSAEPPKARADNFSWSGTR